MWHLYYNIHDLLNVEVCGNRRFDKSKVLRYSFFETEKADNPDIILRIGKFAPSNQGCQVVGQKYHIKDNYVYYRFSGWRAKWEVEISGFETGSTKVNFNGTVRNLKGFLFPSLLPQDILTPLIEYKLAQKNCFLLHGGAVAKDMDTACILIGRGGALKTSLIMDLVRHGFSLLGDDRFILGAEKVTSFIVSPFYIDYELSHMATEERSFLDTVRLLRRMLRSHQKYTLPVLTSSVPKAILFIERKDRTGIKKSGLNLQQAVSKLIANNKLDMELPAPSTPYGYFLQLMLAYSFIFPQSQIASYWDNLRSGLEGSLKEVPCYLLEIPLEYNTSVFQEASNLLDDVVRSA
ncbi:hypothetical protein ACFLVG_02665 [Chloroflexota bacterium]